MIKQSLSHRLCRFASLNMLYVSNDERNPNKDIRQIYLYIYMNTVILTISLPVSRSSKHQQLHKITRMEPYKTKFAKIFNYQDTNGEESIEKSIITD